MRVLGIVVGLWIATSAVAARADTIKVYDASAAYLECGFVDVATARRAARARHGDARQAIIAASGRAMEVLAKAKWMRGLERLRVCTDDRGLRALAKVRWKRLVDLEIGVEMSVLLSAEPVSALVSSPWLEHLERLQFVASDSEAEKTLGVDGALALAASANLPRLRTLDLEYNPIDDAAILAIIQSPLAQQLEVLNLCRTFGGVDADDLIEANLTSLERLCVLVGELDNTNYEHLRVEAVYPGVLSPYEWLDEP